MKILFALFLILFFLSCKNSHVVKVTSPKAFTDQRDGERYGYITIKGDDWMTENIRYNVEGSKLNPNNPNILYGRLYNWRQAMKACPSDWRLSTDLDWMMLEQYCVPKDSILLQKISRGQNVRILKSKKYWTPKGSDSLKLNILPAGWANYNGFHVLYEAALFWTSDSHPAGGILSKKFAYYRVIGNNESGIYYDLHDKETYLSCRCVRNSINTSLNEK